MRVEIGGPLNIMENLGATTFLKVYSRVSKNCLSYSTSNICVNTMVDCNWCEMRTFSACSRVGHEKCLHIRGGIHENITMEHFTPSLSWL